MHGHCQWSLTGCWAQNPHPPPLHSHLSSSSFCSYDLLVMSFTEPSRIGSSSGGSNNNNTGKKNCVYLIPSSTAITAAACFLYIVPARVASRKGRNSTRRCRRRTLTCRVPRYCINNMKHTLLVYDSSWTHGLNIVSLVLYTCLRERGRGE